jgi:hypothetical protein
LVEKQINKKIKEIISRFEREKSTAKNIFDEYKRLKEIGKAGYWIRIPQPIHISIKNISEREEDNIKTERDDYGLVRVIELPKVGDNFILVYGDTNDEQVRTGTGPFSKLQEAKDWFLKGGR